MSNRFFITLLVVIAVIIGAFALSKNNKSDNSGSSATQPTEYVRGSKTSGVRLVEYGDFQCPACKQYFPIVEQIVEKYKDQIEFQFRHFPLVQIHQNAFAAHRAAEAAAQQDNFWEMYNLLYQGQDSWASASNPSATFEAYAGELSLDIEKFKADVASQATNDKINADLAEGKKFNITGTPAFVLDGKLIENPRSFEDFVKLIDEAIAAKKNT